MMLPERPTPICPSLPCIRWTLRQEGFLTHKPLRVILLPPDVPHTLLVWLIIFWSHILNWPPLLLSLSLYLNELFLWHPFILLIGSVWSEVESAGVQWFMVEGLFIIEVISDPLLCWFIIILQLIADLHVLVPGSQPVLPDWSIVLEFFNGQVALFPCFLCFKWFECISGVTRLVVRVGEWLTCMA